MGWKLKPRYSRRRPRRLTCSRELCGTGDHDLCHMMYGRFAQAADFLAVAT